jgi:hypothetical protein
VPPWQRPTSVIVWSLALAKLVGFGALTGAAAWALAGLTSR